MRDVGCIPRDNLTPAGYYKNTLWDWDSFFIGDSSDDGIGRYLGISRREARSPFQLSYSQNSCAVGRMTMSPISTSAGCSMA